MFNKICVTIALLASIASIVITVDTLRLTREIKRLLAQEHAAPLTTQKVKAITKDANVALVTFQGHWSTETELARTRNAIQLVIAEELTSLLLGGQPPGERKVGSAMRTALASAMFDRGAMFLDHILEIELEAGP